MEVLNINIWMEEEKIKKYIKQQEEKEKDRKAERFSRVIAGHADSGGGTYEIVFNTPRFLLEDDKLVFKVKNK